MKRGKEKELLCLGNYVVWNVVLSQLSSLLEQWTDSAIMAIFATPGANISSKKKKSVLQSKTLKYYIVYHWPCDKSSGFKFEFTGTDNSSYLEQMNWRRDMILIERAKERKDFHLNLIFISFRHVKINKKRSQRTT